MIEPKIPSGLRAPLREYLNLLDRWNRIHALTALPLEARWEELVLDSAALLGPLKELPAGSRVGDFGTGMGMPAILLAFARPDLRVLALDKSKKKIAFVRQAALELGLANLDLLHGRFEQLPPLGLDAGVAKALAPLADLAAWWERHGRPGAAFYALKGPERLSESQPPGWDLEALPYRLPTKGERAVVRMKKGG